MPLLRALLRTAIASRGMDVIAALVPRLSGDALDMLMIHMPDSGALPKVREALLGRFMARLESGAFPRAFHACRIARPPRETAAA